MVHDGWTAHARVAFADHMSGTKRKYKNGQKIPWMNEDVQAGWRALWDDPAHVARSLQASKNRRSEPAGPGTGIARHYGGSRNVLRHASDLAKGQGISIEDAAYDTFRRLHLKNGQYTDGRSQHIDEAVQRRLASLREAGEEITPAVASSIYREEAAIDPKGRVFGMGVMSQSLRSASRSSQSPFSSAPTEEVVQLRSQVEQQQSELVSQRMELDAVKEQMAFLMQKLGGGSSHGGDGPSSSPC